MSDEAPAEGVPPEEGENGEFEDDAAEYERDPLEQVWVFGCNDHLKIDEEIIAAKSGNFFEDFLANCEEFRMVPHPSMTKETLPGAIICKGLLVDLCSLKIMRHILPTSQSIEHLKFSDALLDAQMVSLLTDALAEERTTVKSLTLDWNKIDLPLVIPEEVKEFGEMEALERARMSKQSLRDVQVWTELVLESTKKTKFSEVLEMLNEAWAPSASRQDLRMISLETDKLDYAQFTYHFGARLGVPLRDEVFQKAFAHFDGPEFSGGESKTSLAVIQKVCSNLPRVQAVPPAVEGEDPPAEDAPVPPDPIGDVWRRLIETSFIENLSMRCCSLSRLEAPGVATGIRAQVYLRQLNLYGNNLSDDSVALIADALADNSSLEYVGLGNNLIGNRGFAALCDTLGAKVIEDRAEADARIAAQSAKSMPAPSKDGAGTERPQRESVWVDEVVEIPAPAVEEGESPPPPKYYWFRNKTVKKLNLSYNLISDWTVVQECLALGNPEACVTLTGNAVARDLKDAQWPQPKEDAVVGFRKTY
ncbi:unnamed protein product [Amoebophrya sp. A25]|nr:unnamed protein product [Amoebophrya sp. A25]|eukprot:GSA25T00006292001.1